MCPCSHVGALAQRLGSHPDPSALSQHIAAGQVPEALLEESPAQGANQHPPAWLLNPPTSPHEAATTDFHLLSCAAQHCPGAAGGGCNASWCGMVLSLSRFPKHRAMDLSGWHQLRYENQSLLLAGGRSERPGCAERW